MRESGENRLGSGQREMRHRELATEKRCLHPNEMRDDIEVIGHVPKLMAIWLTNMGWKFHANFILQEMNFRSIG